MNTLLDASKVYVVGLGGVGVSAIAKYLLRHGVHVAGSDPVRSPLIDDVESLGAEYFSEVDPKRVAQSDAVLYSDACPPDHPELVAAQIARLPAYSFAQALGQIMAPYPARVAISGTNGKSTTTALTALLLVGAQQEPTVFVGSRVTEFDGNLRMGSERIFVAEADEYRDHFHQLDPTLLVVTNIEPDHLDYFQTPDRVFASFRKMMMRVAVHGDLVVNRDDPKTWELAERLPNLTSFGTHPSADLVIRDISVRPGRQDFSASWQGQDLGPFRLHRPATFNILNTAAAMATALRLGANASTFAATIAAFGGIWRRFEILNPKGPTTIISDYAHHPTAIIGTLSGTKAFFPNRKIIAVYQPHHHNRLATLYPQFMAAFDQADQTIITDVYAVLGREEKILKTSRELVSALQLRGRTAHFASTPAEAKTLVQTIAQPGDVVLIMGAGDIWTIAEPLAQHYGN